MKAPKPTDPIVAGQAQNGQNLYAGNINTAAQSGTITNPWGTRTTALSPRTIVDPLTGKDQTVYAADVTETLSPEQQRIFNENQASEYNLSQYGNQQTQELLRRGASPFAYNTGDHEAWFARNYDNLNAEGNAQANESLRSRLANQGIKVGSDAYDREMKALSGGQSQARLNALMGSQQQGYEQALATRNQQTNEPLAIATGTQINQPQFTPGRTGTVATTDMMSAYQNYDNQRMNRYNSKMANLGGLFSGLGSMFALSDRRAKTDIEKVGKVKGQNVYEYRYKGEAGDAPKTLGVMAQEVMKKQPDAVVKGNDGLFRVNYSKAFQLGA